MKALKITAPGSMEVADTAVPQYGPGEILIQVGYVGFCGSDLSTYLGKNPLISYPRVPGHEIAGVIEEKGRDVASSFQTGSPVTVIPYTSCGECASCRRGRYNACRYNETMGVQREGAMQEYIAVHHSKVLMVPDLSLSDLALVEPLTVGFHAVERAQVTGDDTVVVLGSGMIGMGAVIGSRRKHATVIGVDIDDQKLDMTKKMGAAHTINSSREDLHSVLSELTGGRGPDVVIEAVGSPRTYRSALQETAFTGRVVCIGYAGEEVPLATKLIVQKELDIMGSRNATPDDFRRVGDYLRDNSSSTRELITRFVSFEEALAAMEEWADNPGKIIKLMLQVH